jgi:AbrB family looped-hinge helix DNA binding protein
MTTLVRIHRKGQMTLPSRLRSAVGVAEGDLVEASVQRGRIVLTPKPVTHRVDRELAKGLEDVRKGRIHGPFTAQEASRFLKNELKTRNKAK